ncbi:type II toxin-antitoxin system VapC family toxin [Candidatus Fermentibacteria bacterium]|nr:type II toxin-antitoxin system VapC family toxin [Candidatus Fermentibacteria bacterium]
MTYLVDTNVWLERLLDQERSREVALFLDATRPASLSMTDFCLHSIGVVLTRLSRGEAFGKFLSDTIVDSGVNLIRLDAEDLRTLLQVHGRYGLDFDDAYQYAAAEKYNLTIVSLDSDFDRTDRGRKTPGDVLKEMTSGPRPNHEP